jgi:hypothetical protein
MRKHGTWKESKCKMEIGNQGTHEERERARREAGQKTQGTLELSLRKLFQGGSGLCEDSNLSVFSKQPTQPNTESETVCETAETGYLLPLVLLWRIALFLLPFLVLRHSCLDEYVKMMSKVYEDF